MSDNDKSRLDRIERLLESTQQQIDSNARTIAANSAGMAELRQQQQQVQQSLNEDRDSIQQ